MARRNVGPTKARSSSARRTELLGDWSLVPVTLSACEALLQKNPGHRLYSFLDVEAKASTLWLLLPQHKIMTFFQCRSLEEKTAINGWIAMDGFRAFMHPDQRSCFRNPVVDYKDGKLFIRSGKKKITPLE